MLRDFNDSPVGKVMGSSLGRSVIGHAVEGEVRGHAEGGGGGGGGPSQGVGLTGIPYPD